MHSVSSLAIFVLKRDVKLQLTNHAFSVIAEGLTVCPFAGSFLVWLTILPIQGFEVTYAILKFRWCYEHGCFSPFSAKRLLKNTKCDLFGSEKCQLADLVADRDWPIVTVLWAKYHLRKFGFTDMMVNTCKSLRNWVVSANNTNMFRTRLDKFWHNQNIIYNFRA